MSWRNEAARFIGEQETGMKPVIEMIADKREWPRPKEEFSPKHDDGYISEELAAAAIDEGIGFRAGAFMGMDEVDPKHLGRMIRESALSSGIRNVVAGGRCETVMDAFGAGYVAGVLASAGALRQEASALPCAEDACVTEGNAEHVLRYVGLIPPLD